MVCARFGTALGAAGPHPELVDAAVMLIDRLCETFEPPVPRIVIECVAAVYGIRHDERLHVFPITPRNHSLSEWIVSLLRTCPTSEVPRMLSIDTSVRILQTKRIYDDDNRSILSRIRLCRLISAALFVHQFKEVRLIFDWRWTLSRTAAILSCP